MKKTIYITSIAEEYPKATTTIQEACDHVLTVWDGDAELDEEALDAHNTVEVRSVLGAIIEKKLTLPYVAYDTDGDEAFAICAQELDA